MVHIIFYIKYFKVYVTKSGGVPFPTDQSAWEAI